ncbi:peptidoglycan DD-metalloendopeptidase family protein [Psychroflexus gondwanensis]|jgi:septal ring factor EnvC (AmiA/AmiB activator)|uniref:murein hydrolase activator EnvC family protein n=1 Tax=Psychroflexus gondwanensis TaxID=251 RepID=UPI0011BDA804|nr:peptidoglycan DD-metalloendopeptidase family protein [Psychroflexus gondwanensis]TXE21271.1 peptidoglycan DD-metalloendopeptidase family protein [Psychroflexus gondwanensis]
MKYLQYIFVFLIVCASQQAFTQTRVELEAKRQAIQQEIDEINKIIRTTETKGRSALSEFEDLQNRIKATERLIQVNNQEANLLTREITSNANKIDRFRNELIQLKDDYEQMIQKSYRSKSNKSRIMFLFSSESFLQAYKRIQYMKQFAQYRKKQGVEVMAQTKALQNLNSTLFEQRRDQEKILAENRRTKSRLVSDKNTQEQLLASINKQKKKYALELNQKQKEVSRIDREIDRLIREAIAKENKKVGSDAKATFELTPEAKALAKDFANNKGKLPWPVKSGVVSMRFGERPHPIVKTIKIMSNGVRIDTEKNGTARAVFEGEVSQVSKIPGANVVVMVRHGDYLSIYNNLQKVFVKSGDKVERGEELGEIGINSSSGKTTLIFQLFKNTSKLNPEQWIYKM